MLTQTPRKERSQRSVVIKNGIYFGQLISLLREPKPQVRPISKLDSKIKLENKSKLDYNFAVKKVQSSL